MFQIPAIVFTALAWLESILHFINLVFNWADLSTLSKHEQLSIQLELFVPHTLKRFLLELSANVHWKFGDLAAGWILEKGKYAVDLFWYINDYLKDHFHYKKLQQSHK